MRLRALRPGSVDRSAARERARAPTRRSSRRASTPRTSRALSPGGVDAIGGVGDCALSNGTLCAVVSDPVARERPRGRRRRRSSTSATAGAATTSSCCVQPLANLDRRGAVRGRDASSRRVASDEARIDDARTRSSAATSRRVYALDRARSRAPAHHHDASRAAKPATRLFAFGDVALHAQHALRPFALDSRGRVPADGFAHPAARPREPALGRARDGAGRHAHPRRRAVDRAGHRVRAARDARRARARRRGAGRAPRRVALRRELLGARRLRGAVLAAAAIGSARSRSLQTLLRSTSPIGETLVFEREMLVSRARRRRVADRSPASPARVASRGRVDDPRRAPRDPAAPTAASRREVAPAARRSLRASRCRPARIARACSARRAARRSARSRSATRDVDLGAARAPPLGARRAAARPRRCAHLPRRRRHPRPALRRRAARRALRHRDAARVAR